MKTAKALSWVIAVAGAWEVIAPFILKYTSTGSATWNAIIIGLAIVILGVWAALSAAESTVKNLNWVNAVLGAWLIIAPFILSYSHTTTAMWNNIIIGVIVLALAAWAAVTAGGSAERTA
ncbi:MAG: SPW repeat protein [Anaerolineae bacterium]|nr:SPW repeat protein [Anaerolineae bacterium]